MLIRITKTKIMSDTMTLHLGGQTIVTDEENAPRIKELFFLNKEYKTLKVAIRGLIRDAKEFEFDASEDLDRMKSKASELMDKIVKLQNLKL